MALWECTKAVHEALGDPNFEALVPRPPEPDLPVDPREEWVRLQQGEDVRVNPQDNDELHLIRHMKDLKLGESDPNGGDPDALQKLVLHYHDHILQLQQKKLMQAVVEQAVKAAAELSQAGPLAFPNGLFGNPPSQPPGNPQAQGPFLYSGHPEVMHEQ